jgi:hypothetical protein
LALLKVYPSVILNDINSEEEKRTQAAGEKPVWTWVGNKNNCDEITNLIIEAVYNKSHGKKPEFSESTTGRRILNWAFGKNDGGFKIIDEQMTIIEKADTLGPKSLFRHGYAAELRSVKVEDTTSLESVKLAAIKVIELSRGSK